MNGAFKVENYSYTVVECRNGKHCYANVNAFINYFN